MTNQEIKQLVRREYGSMAHLGRKVNPPVTGQTVSLVIDGKRTSQRLRRQIAQKLKLTVKQLNAAHSTLDVSTNAKSV